MRPKSSISDLDAQMERLRERREFLVVKSAERFARAAIKSGLAEMEIADAEVERIVDEIATRFRKPERRASVAASTSLHRSPSGETGAPAEAPHDH
ncbi:TraC family protein [Ciceribacter ferrooxidans]|uniref:Pilus assembly protein n=1 Tax=Ciceribacter ferrooxidans TaxID=2509717 RepID=A0A4Q2TWW3_9HYPH|nr:TraC family protein [Ciceribacter ferrooxidans]RYC23276.1 pilus assembly protein [Ciceribacter ferrooxidans]